MKFATWQDSYNLDMPEIDDQHKMLFDVINELWDSIAFRKPFEDQMKLIEQLEHYTVSHFTEEESFMRKVGYPGFDEHKVSHDEFAKRVADEKKNLLDGAEISLDMLHFLKNWLVKHILLSDKHFSKFFHENLEVKPPPSSSFSRFFRKIFGG